MNLAICKICQFIFPQETINFQFIPSESIAEQYLVHNMSHPSKEKDILWMIEKRAKISFQS